VSVTIDTSSNFAHCTGVLVHLIPSERKARIDHTRGTVKTGRIGVDVTMRGGGAAEAGITAGSETVLVTDLRTRTGITNAAEREERVSEATAAPIVIEMVVTVTAIGTTRTGSVTETLGAASVVMTKRLSVEGTTGPRRGARTTVKNRLHPLGRLRHRRPLVTAPVLRTAARMAIGLPEGNMTTHLGIGIGVTVTEDGLLTMTEIDGDEQGVHHHRPLGMFPWSMPQTARLTETP
jgi:hypothetical protein